MKVNISKIEVHRNQDKWEVVFYVTNAPQPTKVGEFNEEDSAWRLAFEIQKDYPTAIVAPKDGL